MAWSFVKLTCLWAVDAGVGGLYSSAAGGGNLGFQSLVTMRMRTMRVTSNANKDFLFFFLWALNLKMSKFYWENKYWYVEDSLDLSEGENLLFRNDQTGGILPNQTKNNDNRNIFWESWFTLNLQMVRSGINGLWDVWLVWGGGQSSHHSENKWVFVRCTELC